MEGFLQDLDVLDARRFRIAVRRLADSWSYGTDRSAFLGSGVEYAQSRPYEPGDPVRAIDWRVTARAGRFFVKEYEAPKRMPVQLLIDTSASMTLSSVERSKYEIALFIAGGVALASLDRVSPVGVACVGDRDVRVEPSLSNVQVLGWLQRLRRFRYDEGTRLGRRINEIAPRLHSRSLLIVLSDLHDEDCVQALKRASQRHDCAVLQLVDPAEERLAGAGFLRAREAETGREFKSHGRRQHLRQDELAQSLKRGGIDHFVVRTDRTYAGPLRHFFETRGLLGRAAR